MRCTSPATIWGAAAVVAAVASIRIVRARRSTAENARPSLSSQDNSAEEREARMVNKFRAQDGITFFFFPRSPCARRVWLTLLEKGIKYNGVMVNLMQGEQRHPAYLAINPQGKVPAIRVQNVPGIPDVCLYESQAIVEWLDEAPFPPSALLKTAVVDSVGKTWPLFPSDPGQRFEVKMWQYWELSLAEEFWPLSRQQVDGTIWRWQYSRAQFKEKLKQWSSGDPFYEAKAKKMYEGEFLSKGAVRRSILRILRGFAMLEAAVKEVRRQKGAEGCSRVRWLVGDSFSQADIAVYPRLVKAPQNGILSTPGQRALFPSVIALFGQLAVRPAFAKFRWRDNIIWSSGVFPRFAQELGWWGWLLPWSTIIAVGNWRSGVNFRRFTLSDFKNEVKVALRDESLKVSAARAAHDFVCFASVRFVEPRAHFAPMSTPGDPAKCSPSRRSASAVLQHRTPHVCCRAGHGCGDAGAKSHI